jgi:hypothetical protein
MADMQRMLVGFATHLQESERKQLLVYAVYLQAMFTVPLVILCLVVSGTANSGFAFGLFAALLNILFVGGSNYVLTQPRESIVIGFVIGVGTMMSMLNFMNSIFWGQLSGCEAVVQPVGQYTCDSPAAYGAVCTFSVFLFLTQGLFTVGMGLWKSELISDPAAPEVDTESFYDDLPQASGHYDKQQSVDL